MLPWFSCRDLVAVPIKYNEEGAGRRLVVCSAYLPYDSKDPPPSKELEDLMRFCDKENLYLVVGCDSNAHHSVWGSTNCNSRGEALVEFLNTTNLDILNQGNEPTFSNWGRSEVTDITLGSLRFLESIIDWEVSSEPSLSDHRHILFILRGSVPVRLIRNPRGTKWGSFRQDPRDRLGRGPVMDMKSEAVLGLAIHWVQQALVLAYEDNCPLNLLRRVGKFWSGLQNWNPLEEEWDSFLTNADQIRIRIVGTSIERLSVLIGKRWERPLKVLGGPSVAPSMTYLGQLDYTGLFLGTLKLRWVLWWLLRAGERSPRGKLYSSC